MSFVREGSRECVGVDTRSLLSRGQVTHGDVSRINVFPFVSSNPYVYTCPWTLSYWSSSRTLLLSTCVLNSSTTKVFINHSFTLFVHLVPEITFLYFHEGYVIRTNVRVGDKGVEGSGIHGTVDVSSVRNIRTKWLNSIFTSLSRQNSTYKFELYH